MGFMDHDGVVSIVIESMATRIHNMKVQMKDDAFVIEDQNNTVDEYEDTITRLVATKEALQMLVDFQARRISELQGQVDDLVNAMPSTAPFTWVEADPFEGKKPGEVTDWIAPN